MILTELVELFLESRKSGTTGARKQCAAKTLTIYANNMRSFLNFLLTEVTPGGVAKYGDIQRMHIHQFNKALDARIEAGTFAKASKYQVMRTLRAFFNWVDKDEELVDQKGERLKGRQKWLPVIPKNPRRLDVPANVSMKKFKNSFDTHSRWGYRDYVVCCLMTDDGMRAGEVCNLEIRNILWAEKLLYVTGKLGDRAVPISSDMIPLLKGWLKRREGCVTAKDSPYVFVSKRSPKMDVNAVGNRFRKHRAKHGLPRITAHTFRHAFATKYLAKGGDIAKLQNIMGHASLHQLMGYVDRAKLGGKVAQDELERMGMLKD
jgi:site-specific recombinase XerD